MFVRDYRAEDARAVVEVFRDSYNTLRASKGGMHPDEEVEEMLRKPDGKILARLTRNCVLLVAEVRGTGEVAGVGGIRDGWEHRILRSTVCMNLYVKERFQRGKAGVSVGAMLRRATIERAKSMGYRKACGYAYPEAKGYEARFGVAFFPAYNTRDWNSAVTLHYHEFELRPNVWNRIRMEAYMGKLVHLWLNAWRLVVRDLK